MADENGLSGALSLGYLRVSTAEQRDAGGGLAAQEFAVRAEASKRGWRLELVVDAGVSGGVSPSNRPAMRDALRRLDGGEARVLVVNRLDRLGRNLAEVAALLDRAQAKGWFVVVTDASGLDMSSPTGRLVAGVLASAAAFERDLLRARTREGMAARRAAGVRMGRPSVLPATVVAQVVGWRKQGHTLRAIAALLGEAGVATAHGGQRWHPETVAAVLRSQMAASFDGDEGPQTEPPGSPKSIATAIAPPRSKVRVLGPRSPLMFSGGDA